MLKPQFLTGMPYKAFRIFIGHLPSRIIILVLLSLLFGSCSIVKTKPQITDIKTRYEAFPKENLPLEAAAEIRWNEYQIPFIKAESDRDCAFLLGMIHAHLRLGQIYLFREVVNHRLASHAGPFATAIDHSLMAMDLFRATKEIEEKMDPHSKMWFSAFTEGLNYYQAQMNDIPSELKALNISPTSFELQDIIKIGRLVSADVNWFSWFSYLKLQDEPGWEAFWQRLLAGGGGTTTSLGFHPTEILNHLSKSGSNAISVSPSKSTTDGAIMASDPHLGLMLPNMWLIGGYQCPSYHVMGMMFPALPVVLIGRNEAISFSGTNMRSASSDLYELDLEQQKEITDTRQKIKVRAWFDKKVVLRQHPIGPIISDAPLFKANGKTIAMRWVGHQYSDELSAALKMNRASNWKEFVDSFDTYAVSGQNYLYADKQGNIGLVPAVKIPIREYQIPASIALNADEDKVWNTYYKAGELPNIYNPASGFVASANNQPVKAKTALGFFFSSDDRINRMQSYIAAKEKVGFEDMQYLHTDTYVESAHALALLFVNILSEGKFGDQNPKNTQVITAIQNWDGYYHSDSFGALVFELLQYYFATDFYNRLYDKPFAKSILSSDMLSQNLVKDIQNANSEIVNSTLQHALNKTRKRARKFANWGEMHTMGLNHSLGRVPLIGKRYRFGEFAVGGSTNSLMKTARSITDKKHFTTYGANARFIALMHDIDTNYFVLMGGQDGWLGSPGLTDQVPLWKAGKYINLPLKWESVIESFKLSMPLKAKSETTP